MNWQLAPDLHPHSKGRRNYITYAGALVLVFILCSFGNITEGEI